MKHYTQLLKILHITNGSVKVKARGQVGNVHLYSTNVKELCVVFKVTWLHNIGRFAYYIKKN